MKVFQKKFLQPALRSRGARAGFELAERSSSSLTSSCSAPRDKSSDSRASFSVWLGSESSSAKKYLASSLEEKREKETTITPWLSRAHHSVRLRHLCVQIRDMQDSGGEEEPQFSKEPSLTAATQQLCL